MSASPKLRDHRIDWLRGLALASIFINHMPGNWLENWTTRNFGFSDAAEVFVLLAGVAAALAFFNRFEQGEQLAVSKKAGRRAITLYLAHLGATLAAASLFALVAAAYGNPDFLDLIGVAPLFSDPWPGIAGILSGGHQLGYFNILPMYVVLLSLTPLLLWLAVRSLWFMLGVSVTVYLAANLVGLNVPNFPTDGAWYFNPFAWQLLFSIGMALGVMRLRGQSIAWHPLAYAASLSYVAFAAIWVLFSLGGDMGFGLLPSFMATFHKTNLPLSRLLHVLALSYVLVHSPIWGWMQRISRTNPLALLGRNSLSVFVTGSLASMVGYIVLVQNGGGFLLETALVVLGLTAMLISAAIAENGIVKVGHTVSQTLAGWSARAMTFLPMRKSRTDATFSELLQETDDVTTVAFGQRK
jgi:hypothetical protein